MQLGQPAHLKDQIKDGGGLMRAKLVEGENIHRVLFGPVKTSLLYYPTLVEDENGVMQQRMRVIKRPASGCSLDVLASLDRRVRASRGEKNAKSSLDPSTKWLYMVMDKGAEGYPRIQMIEYPYTVYKKLIELESAIATKDPSKLRHGLVFMWDAIITKTIDKTKGIQFGTSYDVTVDPENKYTGKVPVSYLGMPEEVKEKIQFDKFFDEAEYAAIQDCSIDLEVEGKPDDPELIAQKLAENPIYLGATNPDGSYRFPSVEKFQEQLDKLGIGYLEGEMDKLDKPKVRELEEDTTKKKPKSKKKKAAKTEEIVFEEEKSAAEVEVEFEDDTDEEVVIEETSVEAETAEAEIAETAEEFPEW